MLYASKEYQTFAQTWNLSETSINNVNVLCCEPIAYAPYSQVSYRTQPELRFVCVVSMVVLSIEKHPILDTIRNYEASTVGFLGSIPHWMLSRFGVTHRALSCYMYVWITFGRMHSAFGCPECMNLCNANGEKGK